MSRPLGLVILCTAVLALGCAQGATTTESSAPVPIKAPETSNHDSKFAMVVHVIRRDPPRSEAIAGALIRISDLHQRGISDSRGVAGPFEFLLRVGNQARPTFPHEIEVSKDGYKTCIVRFGSPVFPDTGTWWTATLAEPLHLFVALPDGQGEATGDQCYAGRSAPQTPGPGK